MKGRAMALYEYKCKDCDAVSEILVYGDDSDVTCKSCGSANVERLLSTFAVSSNARGSAGPVPSCPTGGCCGGACGIA